MLLQLSGLGFVICDRKVQLKYKDCQKGLLSSTIYLYPWTIPHHLQFALNKSDCQMIKWKCKSWCRYTMEVLSGAGVLLYIFKYTFRSAFELWGYGKTVSELKSSVLEYPTEHMVCQLLGCSNYPFIVLYKISSH